MSTDNGKDLERLFADFKRRFMAGDGPDAAEYLERAGDGADQLAVRIVGLLATTTPPLPNDDAIAEMLKEPALATLSMSETYGGLLSRWRRARSESRADFAKKLAADLGVSHEVSKVKRYYADLENDLLPPTGLDARVTSSLTNLLGIPRTRLAELARRWKPPASTSERAAFARGPSRSRQRPGGPSLSPDSEVDQLFRKGT